MSEFELKQTIDVNTCIKTFEKALYENIKELYPKLGLKHAGFIGKYSARYMNSIRRAGVIRPLVYTSAPPITPDPLPGRLDPESLARVVAVLGFEFERFINAYKRRKR